MIPILNKSFYKNGYLLIIAAWLFTISFIFSNYWLYSSSPRTVQKQLENYLKRSEKQFESFTADTVALKEIINNASQLSDEDEYINDGIGLFVYTPAEAGNLSLRFWNNSKMLPDNKDLERADGKYFTSHQKNKFEFVKKTFYIKDKKVIAAGLIPVYWDYFIENQYLQSEFAGAHGAQKRFEIVASNADFYISNGDGKTLFGLSARKKIQDQDNTAGDLSVALRVLSIIFVLIFLNVFAFDIVQKKGWVKGFLFLTATIFILRFLSYHFPFPFNFRNLKLFDPFIYASNFLHPSLGDLLINVILLFWLISFVKFAAINDFKKAGKVTGNKALWLSLILCIFLIFLSFLAAGIIRSLISDSQISFDVTNFSGLTIYSLFSFIILCFIILTFFHFSHIALLFINKCSDVPVYIKYGLTAIAGLVYLSTTLNSQASASNVIVLLWLLLYMFIMEYRKEDIFVPILRSSFFLIWLIFFAGSITALIIYQNNRVKFELSRKDAETLSDEADNSAQNYMRLGIADINSEFLTANFNRLSYEVSNKKIKDSLINEYFSGYLNRYDTKIFTFDKSYRPLYNEDSLTFDVIAGRISNRSKRTPNPDLYFYENEFNGFNLLYQKEIFDTIGNTQGYFFVVAEPNRYKNQSVSPELFKQVDDKSTDLDMTYAVYSKGELINSYGDYNFPSRIPKSQFLRQEYKEVKKEDNTELWYNAGNNKMVILVKNKSVFLESITLFAYLFGSFLFIVVLFQAGHLLIRFRFRFNRIRHGLKFSIRDQIQGAIIFISIFSFLVIAISTISFYINRFNQTNSERLVKAIKTLANEIESQVIGQQEFNEGIPVYEPGSNRKLQNTIREISEIHSVDANLYDLSGNLILSTQPYIFNKQILSKMMEPKAFSRLHYNNDIQVIQKEHASHFSFLSIYTVVKDENGKAFAYLNIPYLNTELELNQEISNFLVTLINLNAFIFVIAGAISVLLTNRITNSFTLIAGKMKDIHLGKANEVLTWNTNDEIGALVSEYNKMVKKLEESAHALAKSEREGAWREMARQVAHEIKNPLTPMKLSIQYLQRAIQEKNPNMEQLSQKVSTTLVEQIDQLAKIASDFSQFANIANVTIERFNVNELLHSLINLYSTNEKLQIVFNHPTKPAIIIADRSQISRLFTNLFQNAVEASEAKQTIPINISEEIHDNKLLISISDEGAGIAPEKREKIFTPNFTTKSSGTGLGLAISKGIVENANGKIWFDTEEGKGTTFHVLLPLVSLPGS